MKTKDKIVKIAICINFICLIKCNFETAYKGMVNEVSILSLEAQDNRSLQRDLQW